MKKHLRNQIQRKKSKFEEWERRNPSKQFKDFFGETVQSKMGSGKDHLNLGGNLPGNEFGKSGQRFFKTLLALGLKEDDTCVEYGCGTLRAGIHAIEYLRPGAYWGLDISEFLLAEGRKLLGEELWEEKQPRLRLICPESVAEVAACKPAMLFSVKVLIHVHPAELPEFISNIMTIIGTDGQAIIKGVWSDKATLQFSGRSWAHSAPVIRDLALEMGGNFLILNETECQLEPIGQIAKKGTFRLSRIKRI